MPVDQQPVTRYALFIDVGYLYAAAGQALFGVAARPAYRVETAGVVEFLLHAAAERAGGDLVRMYWYDAARDRVPTVEHRQVAVLPHVKVRLGNLNRSGQQKGVDALLRHDLETLARHQAVTDVILLAGDEDLLGAVENAQTYGVRVHVWGIEPPYGTNQAERLVWEADTVMEFAAEVLAPYFTAATALRPAQPPADASARPPVPAAPAGRPTPATVFPPRLASRAAIGPDQRTMVDLGASILARWMVTRGRDNVADLLPGPVLPTVIDRELLVEAEQRLNCSLRAFEDARRWLREGFWEGLRREFDASQQGRLRRSVGDAAGQGTPGQ